MPVPSSALQASASAVRPCWSNRLGKRYSYGLLEDRALHEPLVVRLQIGHGRSLHGESAPAVDLDAERDVRHREGVAERVVSVVQVLLRNSPRLDGLLADSLESVELHLMLVAYGGLDLVVRGRLWRPVFRLGWKRNFVVWSTSRLATRIGNSVHLLRAPSAQSSTPGAAHPGAAAGAGSKGRVSGCGVTRRAAPPPQALARANLRLSGRVRRSRRSWRGS